MKASSTLMGMVVAGLVVAGCSQTRHAAQTLGGAYSSAVGAGKKLHLPNAGDVGLDKVDADLVQREFATIVGVLPSGADTKKVIAVACEAKHRYESGTAATIDQAAAQALAGQGVHVSAAVIARIEQRLIRGAESTNPAPAAAAVFACKWASGD